jgi:hypothetical protein
MATRKKAGDVQTSTFDSLYDEVIAEIENESAARKRAILKERILEVRKARKVLDKLEAQLEALKEKPLDEFDD